MPGAVVLDDASPAVPEPLATATPEARPSIARRPVTPEQVVREAKLGDLLLRILVIALAVALGTSWVTTTRPLVSIRTAEAYADAGSLFIAEPFSQLTAGGVWRNASWLLDLVLGLIYAVGGWPLVSIWTGVQAAKLAAAASLVRRPGVSTWPASVLAALMLLAVWPAMTPTADFVTPLAAAFVIAAADRIRPRLHRSPRLLLLLPAMCVLVVQLDDDALPVVALAAALCTASFGQTRRIAILSAVACLAAPLLHPFPGVAYRRFIGQVLQRSPMRSTLGGEYPLSPYLADPVWEPRFWFEASPSSLAAFALALGAIGLLLVTRRLRSVDAAVVFAAVTLAGLCGHYWPFAAVCCAMLSTRTLADWTARSFAAVPRADRRTLRFGRRGRGLTAIALLALTVLPLTGRLPLADGRRFGLGYEPYLQLAIEGTNELVAASDEPLQAFPLRIEQGDLLIWAGAKSLVDSRLELFLPVTLPSFAAFRGQVIAPSVSADTIRTQLLDRGVNGVLVRTYGRNPASAALSELLRSPHVTLTDLTPGAARFTPNGLVASEDRPDGRPPISLVRQAFAMEQVDKPIRGDSFLVPLPARERWLSPQTLRERLVAQPASITAKSQLALALAGLTRTRTARRDEVDLAATLELIRLATEALAERPDAADAAYALGLGLDTNELVVRQRLFSAPARQRPRAADFGTQDGPRSTTIRLLSDLRNHQILAAARQMIRAAPSDRRGHLMLIETYRNLGHPDARLAWMRHTVARFGSLTDEDAASGRNERGVAEEMDRLEEQLALLRSSMQRMRNNAMLAAEVAQSALQTGTPVLALAELTNMSPDALVTDPPWPPEKVAAYSQFDNDREREVLVGSLVRLGRFDDADAVIRATSGPDLPRSEFAIALSRSDYGRALDLLDRVPQLGDADRSRFRLMLLLESNRRDEARRLADRMAGRDDALGLFIRGAFAEANPE